MDIRSVGNDDDDDASFKNTSEAKQVDEGKSGSSMRHATQFMLMRRRYLHICFRMESSDLLNVVHTKLESESKTFIKSAKFKPKRLNVKLFKVPTTMQSLIRMAFTEVTEVVRKAILDVDTCVTANH